MRIRGLEPVIISDASSGLYRWLLRGDILGSCSSISGLILADFEWLVVSMSRYSTFISYKLIPELQQHGVTEGERGEEVRFMENSY